MKREKQTYGIEADNALRSWIELSRAFLFIRAAENNFVESKGLTIHQFGVLEALYHIGNLNVGELTRLILSTPGNMTVVVKNLIAKDLVISRKDKKDKRKTILSISDEGKKLISEIFPEHAEKLSDAFSVITHDEHKMLQSISKKLSKHKRS
ncbi:MAG: MarR family transcriptional regulator [Denitrovibrio sp.]|nr:MAG: MarR family transcriptional regulator [Denitrovibrio sp.]